jgi:hypothetical protein
MSLPSRASLCSHPLRPRNRRSSSGHVPNLPALSVPGTRTQRTTRFLRGRTPSSWSDPGRSALQLVGQWLGSRPSVNQMLPAGPDTERLCVWFEDAGQGRPWPAVRSEPRAQLTRPRPPSRVGRRHLRGCVGRLLQASIGDCAAILHHVRNDQRRWEEEQAEDEGDPFLTREGSCWAATLEVPIGLGSSVAWPFLGPIQATSSGSRRFTRRRARPAKRSRAAP